MARFPSVLLVAGLLCLAGLMATTESALACCKGGSTTSKKTTVTVPKAPATHVTTPRVTTPSRAPAVRAPASSAIKPSAALRTTPVHRVATPKPKAQRVAASKYQATLKPPAKQTAAPSTRYPNETARNVSQATKDNVYRLAGVAPKTPGYVVDHVRPLACGGGNSTANLQLQTVAAGKAKDRWERQGCSHASAKGLPRRH